MKKIAIYAIAISSIVLAACEEGTPSGPTRDSQVRQILPATQGESIVKVMVGGQTLTDPSGYTLVAVPQGLLHGGSETSLVILDEPTTIDAPFSVSGWAYQDGWHGFLANHGLWWDGVYELQLTTPADTTCRRTISVNHMDNDSDGFFNQPASDQDVTFHLTAAEGCNYSTVSNQNPIPASSLSVNMGSVPSTAYTIEAVDFSATASGGFGYGYRYAWKFDAAGGSSENFSGSAFQTGTSIQHTFTTAGTFKVRVLARDGNDVQNEGGNYVLSDPVTIVVQQRPLYGAESAGHTLPGTVEAGEFYATSVSMKNVGQNSWSGTGTVLNQSNDVNIWSPSYVELGGATVTTGQTHTFNFNVGVEEPGFCEYYDNYWQMSSGGTGFGDLNGTTTYIKYCNMASRGLLDRFLAVLTPASAFAAEPGFWPPGEVVQRLRFENFRLPRTTVDADGEMRLRYFASLDAPWPVDFEMTVQFDPGAFVVLGPVVGPRATGYALSGHATGPGEITVRGTRVGSGALDGRGLIFELLLKLRPGARSPDTLPVVELVVTR